MGACPRLTWTGPQALKAFAPPCPSQREAELRGNLRQVSKELKQLRAQGKASADALAQKERELAAALKVGAGSFDGDDRGAPTAGQLLEA